MEIKPFVKMHININSRPKLKSDLQRWIKDCFGVNEKNLELFNISNDAEELVCMVRGDEGYIFGSNQMSGDNYAVYVSDKMQLISDNGFYCHARQYEYDENREHRTVKIRVCGFSFRKKSDG